MESNKEVTLATRNYFAQGTYLTKFKQQFTYSGVAHVITTTLLAPLERWRIISQTQHAFPLRPIKFKGFFNYISRVPKEQGILSFWRGNTASIWMYFYQTLFQIGVYDSIKHFNKQLNSQIQEDAPYLIPFLDNIVFPFVASVVSLAIIHPLDTYRIHLNMSYYKNKQNAQFTKFRHRISQVGKFQNLYQGFWLANAISLINFNFYKHLYHAFNSVQSNGAYDFMNGQFILSLLAVTLVHPLETFKKIYQLNNMHKPALFKGYRGVYTFLQQNKITNTLYNGLVPSLVRTALFVPLYWQILKLWKNQNSSTQVVNKQ